jgi:rhodanese-related sulfurtransferase/DNA-binding transcriptional ArsR family regulator
MAGSDFKGELFEQFARVGKALSNANRLEILEFLAQGEKSVEGLANVCKLSVANTSQHLQQLRYAGLVTSRKEAQKVFYTLSDSRVIELLGNIREIAEKNLAEVNQLVAQFLKTKDDLEPVAAKDLLKLVKAGEVTVIDVRPPDEYESGHVSGAINIPLKELEERIKELDLDKEVIAYCRGPYCMMAFDAVFRLRGKSFRARRLENGFPEWKNAGMPVEEKR